MTSQLESDTARVNEAKSLSPKTPEVRAKSARNATKHELAAVSTIILDCESSEQFQEIRAEFTATRHPCTSAECDTLDQMVVERWCIRRFWMAETALINMEMARRHQDVDKEFPGADPGIHLAAAIKALAGETRSRAPLSRYVSRQNRIYDPAYCTLRELQAARKAERNQATTDGATQPEPTPQTPPSVAENQPEAESLKSGSYGPHRSKQKIANRTQEPVPAANQRDSQPADRKDPHATCARTKAKKLRNESDMTGMRAAGRLATPGDENERDSQPADRKDPHATCTRTEKLRIEPKIGLARPRAIG